jgi:hypothetical protein
MRELAPIYKDRIQTILKAKQHWLFEDQRALKEQIEQTILLGFERSDIYHALRWIKEQCTYENLSNWCKDSLEVRNESLNKTVIFLHAGNLPIVGFQDVLIAILSGVNYNGKLSKKDPYLLAGFIEATNLYSNTSQLRYYVDLEKFKDLNADRLIFSGSDKGAEAVLELAKQKNIIHNQTEIYLRIAHFSLVYFDRYLDSDWMDLTESVLRYNGAGCRSVAIIVSPSDLNFSGCHLTDYAESWLMKNNQTEKDLPEAVAYYKAYYESVGIKTQVWNSTLIVETEPQRMISGIVYWVKGDRGMLDKLKLRYGTSIQSIYGVGNYSDLEPLYKAQFPDLNWKADGIDLLKEFTKI